MTFESTAIGKNVMKLNQSHATIEKYYNEIVSSVKQMEEKKSTNEYFYETSGWR